MEVTYKIETKAITAAAKARETTDETRPYLNGVLLERMPDAGHYSLVATDGHMLVEAISVAQQADLASVIIPASLVEFIEYQSLMIYKSDEQTCDISVSETEITVSMKNGTSARAERLNSHYPDWRRVLPKPSDNPTTPHAKINPKFFALFGESAALFYQSSEKYICIKLGDSTSSPIAISRSGDFGDGQDWRGVFMPMRF